jgi:hypothetical protein
VNLCEDLEISGSGPKPPVFQSVRGGLFLLFYKGTSDRFVASVVKLLKTIKTGKRNKHCNLKRVRIFKTGVDFMKRDGDDSSDDAANSTKRGRFNDEGKDENSGGDGNSVGSEDSEDGEDGEDREDPMQEMTEFLKKHADLTTEQLEEVKNILKLHGIQNFDSLRSYAQDDLIKNFKLKEETAKKIQLAIMKNTCILFAEWAENGGIPSPNSGSAGPSDLGGSVPQKKDGDEQHEQQQPGCRVS